MRNASRSTLVTGYTQTIQQLAAMIDAERAIVSELGSTRLFTHGQPVENVIVFFHGFTNCPQQFATLGEQFFDLGYNVLIPRLPHHGLADRMTRDLTHLTAVELYDLADKATDWAHELGHRVIVVGLSLGGLLAAWLALHRSDLDLSVSIAPDFGVPFLPAVLTRPGVALLRLLPDFYMWWDPRTKAANPASYPFAYPGFPSHSAAEMLAMGMDVKTQARAGKPAARKVLFVTIGGDPAVSNDETGRISRLWQERAPGVVTAYEFDRSLQLPHDMITPESPRTRIDVVYPKLIELITERVGG